MSLIDLADVFGMNVLYTLAFEKLVLPGKAYITLVTLPCPDRTTGIEHVLLGLDVNAMLNNSGFTLHKVLSKLVVKNLFAEVPLPDIPAWNPFSSPFTLGPTALRVIVEDAFSPTSRTVLVVSIRSNHEPTDKILDPRSTKWVCTHCLRLRYRPTVPVYSQMESSGVPALRTYFSSQNLRLPVDW
jgi:hypothetical protein